MRWFDAHNHLQDPRLGHDPVGIVADAAAEGIAGMVVNGTSEADWPQVRRLAEQCPSVIPAFGLHPWLVSARSDAWREALVECLDHTPRVGLGEVGLDRWILDQPLERCLAMGTGPQGPAPLDIQLKVLDEQLDMASARGLPVTLHCLKAWGALRDCLRRRPRLPRGFLLHSYAGSSELVNEWVGLGGWFSISGHSLQPRKATHAAVLRAIPRDRLLLETDAPDQLPPPGWVSQPATDAHGHQVNHPANLVRIAEGVSGLLGIPIEELAAQCESNWLRFFGPRLLTEKNPLSTGFLTAPSGSAAIAAAARPSDPTGSCSGHR